MGMAGGKTKKLNNSRGKQFLRDRQVSSGHFHCEPHGTHGALPAVETLHGRASIYTRFSLPDQDGL